MDPSKFKPNSARFGCSGKDELKKIIEERGAKNTLKSVKMSITVLRSYLAEKNLPQLEDIDLDSLPSILEDFYANARQKDGSKYHVSSMKCIRSNLNRWFQENKNINIITDKNFTKPNLLFKGVQVLGKKEGRAVRKHTVPISDEDMLKLQNYFSIDHMNYPNPRVLQRNVMFNIMYYTCRRGSENLYYMEKDWFETIVTPSGERFIQQSHDELDKNHREDSDSIANQGRIYETGGTTLA